MFDPYGDFPGGPVGPSVDPEAVEMEPEASPVASLPSPSKINKRPLLRKSSSLQMRKMGNKAFATLVVDDDLESWLEQHPYLGGYKPTIKDREFYEQVQLSQTGPSTRNLQRWW